MQVRVLPRQPLCDYARSYKPLSSGAPVVRMLCKINVRERNYRDSAALCVRLAHDRKVGNFKRGSYAHMSEWLRKQSAKLLFGGSNPPMCSIWRGKLRLVRAAIRFLAGRGFDSRPLLHNYFLSTQVGCYTPRYPWGLVQQGKRKSPECFPVSEHNRHRTEVFVRSMPLYSFKGWR